MSDQRNRRFTLLIGRIGLFIRRAFAPRSESRLMKWSLRFFPWEAQFRFKPDKRARELGLVWLALKQASKRGRRGRKCFQSIEAEKTPLTRRHSPRPVIQFLRMEIGIRIWMPQWIQILDYADSYAYFVDYDAEGTSSIRRFFILNWFTNYFLLCGSGGLGSLGLAIPG